MKKRDGKQLISAPFFNFTNVQEKQTKGNFFKGRFGF